MTTSAAAKGKRWERDLREGLRGERLDVEGLKLRGTEDEGDIVVRFVNGHRYILEAKNEARIDLAGHTREALDEADNYVEHRKATGVERADVTAFAVIKRRGRGWKDAYVVTTVRELLHLD